MACYKGVTFREILESIGGRIGLEIEIKGPEPEAVSIIEAVLRDYRPLWETMEITPYEPLHLVGIQGECPGIATDLLIPLSEEWMRLDVVTYAAIQRGRLVRARAVHLHPSQLSPAVMTAVRSAGLDVHAWDVNSESALQLAREYQIPKICTDRLVKALNFRTTL